MVVVLVLWAGLHRDAREIPSPLLGKPAPIFSAPDLKQPKQLLTEENFKGHVTILNLFAAECVACQAEHSVWIEARHDLGDTKMMGLNYKGERQKTLAWLNQYGDPYDQIIDDPQGNIGINWGVYGTPETLIIDKQGIVRYKFVGAVSPSDWKENLLPKIKQWESMDG